MWSMQQPLRCRVSVVVMECLRTFEAWKMTPVFALGEFYG